MKEHFTMANVYPLAIETVANPMDTSTQTAQTIFHGAEPRIDRVWAAGGVQSMPTAGPTD